MCPPIRVRSIRRFRPLGITAGCCRWSVLSLRALLMLALFVALLPVQAVVSPVQAQAAKPDLIPLVIPEGPPAYSMWRPLPPLSAASVPQAVLPISGAVEARSEFGAQSAKDTAVAPPRATELHGLLPHTNDRHFFGLEAVRPGEPFAVTLTVEPAAALRGGEGVNFVVLTESGLQRFLAGADLAAVKVAQGSPMVFDQVGNRLTALVPGAAGGGYTVIVSNHGAHPVTYRLHAEGGLLRDDAGQTFSAVTVDAAEGAVIHRAKPLPWATSLTVSALTVSALTVSALTVSALTVSVAAGDPSVATVAERETAQAGERLMAAMPVRLVEPVRALRLSGTLVGADGRHFFTLAADGKRDEIVLALQLPAGASQEGAGFWVLTQDGVRALVMGGLAEELNLARGLPVPARPGRYETRLRLARDVLYTVVLYHRGDLPTGYVLTVEGGVLVDQYGQTNEAHAAVLEVAVLEVAALNK